VTPVERDSVSLPSLQSHYLEIKLGHPSGCCVITEITKRTDYLSWQMMKSHQFMYKLKNFLHPFDFTGEKAKE